MKTESLAKALTEVTGVNTEEILLVLERKKKYSTERWLEDCGWTAFGCRFVEMRDFGFHGKYLCWNKDRAWSVIDGVGRDESFTHVFRVEAID